MDWLIRSGLFLTLFVLIYSTAALLRKIMQKPLKYRIATYLSDSSRSIYNTPLWMRLTEPLLLATKKYVTKVTPKKYRDYLENQLNRIESPYRPEDLLFLQFSISFIVFCLFLVLLRPDSIPSAVSLILPAGVSFFLPNFGIVFQLRKRRAGIISELPYFIDILAVILQAGVGFENAVSKICLKKQGPLYSELKYFIREMRLGTARKDALNNLSRRLNIVEIDTLVRVLNQGEAMGVSISNTILRQAEFMRSQRQQRVQEQAMKIPVKIIFPLVFFIFPPVFVVILGPGLINIFQSFITR